MCKARLWEKVLRMVQSKLPEGTMSLEAQNRIPGLEAWLRTEGTHINRYNDS